MRLRVTLLWYKPHCFSNVIMLSTYWSLSQHGQLQPHSKSKAWKLKYTTAKWPIKKPLREISGLSYQLKFVNMNWSWKTVFCDNCFCSWTSTLWQQEVDLAYFSGRGYLLLDLSQPVPIQDLFVTEKVSLCSQVEQKGRTDGLLFSPVSTWSPCKPSLTLYSLTSVWIFSILLPRHFQGFWQGEFVQQSKASLVGDHLLYSHDLNVWFRGDVVRRN